MTEMTYPAGQRAIIDLRDSSGRITLKDGKATKITISSDDEGAPFVLQEGETLRIRVTGGTISVPFGLPVEAMVPAAVHLRIERDAREGDTVVRPVAREAASTATATAAAASGPLDADDVDQFARTISDGAQRIFAE